MFKLQLQFQAITSMTYMCIHAMELLEDINSLKILSELLNIPVIPDIITFSNLFINGGDPKMNDVVKYFKVLENSIPKIGLVIQGYPSLFYHVMYKIGLLKVLRQFHSPTALNQRIDNRQGEDIRSETRDNLESLRIIGHFIVSHGSYKFILDYRGITLNLLMDFFQETAGAIGALYVVKNSREDLGDSLQSQTEEKQTIAKVKDLLVNGGAFIIKIESGIIITENK
jgi:hypothetical protein